jgi:hypothetical protein
MGVYNWMLKEAGAISFDGAEVISFVGDCQAD